jgi:hypothetical protein
VRSFERAATLVLGTYLLCTAGWHALRGEWLYADLLHLQVPVPAAALLGALLLFVALLRWPF